VAVAGILAPALSYALGLGEISTNSALNQPLDADIQLISAAGEVDKVTVKLAPNAVFNQAGITRSGILDQLKFEPTSVGGAEVIKITSQGPIQEPFINFIIEVSWPKGKLLREYTVLLDPPVLGGGGVSIPENSATPATAADAGDQVEPQSADSHEGLPPFVAASQAGAEAEVETETFSVSDDTDEAASESEAGDSTGSAESGDVAAVEPEAEQAESFSVTDDTDSDRQGSYSGGSSEIFLSQAGGVEETAPASSEPEVAESESFSVAPDESVEEKSTEVAETEAEAELETFSVTDSEVAEGDQSYDPNEGFSDIFLAIPGVKPITDVADSSLEKAAASDAAGKSSIVAGDEYQVNSGDTLSVLAGKSLPSKGVSVAQMMAAYLRENPDAFANSNINSLKAGYILRVPDESMATQVSNEEAIRELDGHGGEAFAQYRSKMADAAVSQQTAETGANTGAQDPAVNSSEQTGEAVDDEGSVAQTEDKSELEILVPDAEGGDAAGNQVADNGAIQALEKEIALAKERLESKSRETAELQSRVTDLEGIVSAKERLIQLKEEELTGAQQQLSEGAAIQESKASNLEGTVAEKDLLIQQKEEELSGLQQKLSDDTAAQKSGIAELESALAEKDRLIQEKETELSGLQQKLSEGSTAQESKAAEIEGILAEKDRLIQEKEAELSDLHQKLSEDTAIQESKVADFEGVLAEKDRLIQVKDAELADLQQRLSATNSATEQPSDGAAEAADSTLESEVEAPLVGDLEAEAIAELQGEEQSEPVAGEVDMGADEGAGSTEGAEIASDPVIEDPSESAEITPVIDDAQEVVEDSTASKSNPNLLLGAGVGGLLLAMLGLMAFRKKSPKESPIVADDTVDAAPTVKTIVGEDDDKPLYSDGGDDELVEKYDKEDAISDATMVVETRPEPFLESSTHTEKNIVDVDESSISVEDEADIVAAMTAELAAGDLDLDLDVDDDLSSVDGMDSIEDEVLSESNVYLAYGLHDQAIELLKPAVESNPDRADYASKLLEAYHATGDKEAFVQVATALKDQVDDGNNPVWQRAVVMGKDLIPDHALFVNADSGDLTLTAIQNQRAELMDVGENDEPLTEIEVDSKTLPLRRQEGELEVESHLAGEFELPDLDELSQSLQMEGDEVTVALKESQDELSQEILADLTGQLEGFKPDLDHAMDLDEDANLTLADVESELTSLTTGADEMSTKLDLAKAYIDMGDDEGAREALEEVISQGDETQSGEAKKLMDQIV